MGNSMLYQRLPGRARRHFGLSMERERLFMAPDHLLLVQQHAYTETSNRFYFNDIQLISIHQTPWRRSFTIMMGLLALLFIALAFAVSAVDVVGGIFFGVFFTSLCLLLIVLNWVFGPTAATFISTRVQTQRLASLGRLHTARKVVALVQQEIDRVQGSPVAQSVSEPVTESVRTEPLEQYHE